MRRSAATQAAVKGWTYARCGLPGKVLKAAEWSPTASLSEDAVRVRLLCAPIMAHDVQMIMGNYGGYKAEAYPAVAGTEGVGEVVEAGSASSVKKGAKVAFLKQNVGTWTTEAVVQSGHLFDVSSLGLADDQLALLSVYAAAVVMAAEYGDVAGQTCWVLGSEQAVGTALAVALKAKKAKVVTVGDSPGSDYTVDTLASAIQLPAPKFIFNGLGGKALRIATDNAAEEATVVTYDNASREPMDVAGTRAVLNGLQMRSFWYKRWLETSSAAEKEAVFKAAAALAKSGPVKKKSFPFAEFVAAFDSVYSGPTVPVVSMA